MNAKLKITLITAAVGVGLVIPFPPGLAQVYRMVDENGNIYFTDDPGKTSGKYKNVIPPKSIEKKEIPSERQDRPKKEEQAIEVKPVIPPAQEKGERGIETETTQPARVEATPVLEEKAPAQEVIVKPSAPAGQDDLSKIAEVRGLLQEAESLQSKMISGGGSWLGLSGLIIMLGGGIWFMVVAFRTSVRWGMACLFVPFAFLVFLAKYWKKAWMPFCANLLGTILIFGVYLKMVLALL